MDTAIMILKMSVVTGLYVLLTKLLWKRLCSKQISTAGKLSAGVIYGLCSVLSTHFGVDYVHMMLNVRDIGPLAAGLFFDPVSGIVAGLIGGVERYIAGTWWGVGEYTRIACSVSTCLAGFLSAFLNRVILKRKKPSEIYAFFMGAVMEVFHMYVVIITHRSDMSMACYVVSICAAPMIVFTGLGLSLSAAVIKIQVGEFKNPFRSKRKEDVSVSQKFQFWLFAVTIVILVANFGFSFMVQTQSATQYARETMTDTAGDIRETYIRLQGTRQGIDTLINKMGVTEARAIVADVKREGGVDALGEDFLEEKREIYELVSANIVTPEGELLRTAGDSRIYRALIKTLLETGEDAVIDRLSAERLIVDTLCEENVLQVVVNANNVSQLLEQSGLDEAMSYFHVGIGGSFDIISPLGFSIAGDHRSKIMKGWDKAIEKCDQGVRYYNDTIYDVKSMCRVERLETGPVLLMTLPVSEMYVYRDIQSLESGLSDILLFTVIYMLISLLVQQIVVNNLEMVNNSLAKITGGDLNEVVNVRSASEFASLSDDINQTVTVLKGYIAAAEKRIEQELEFARTIQDAALPKNFQFPRNEFELFATMDPAKEVGGDFYDFFFVDNNRLALVIADVSGKGIPAALFMMRSKTVIRSLAEKGRAPAEILFRANNVLCKGNDAEMFVTAWIGIINLRTGVMRCANAGHEYPALMRAGGDYELFMDKHGLALAAMENMPFKEYEIRLNPGDRLFVYTDGIPEAIDEKMEQYGSDRLLNKLNSLKDATMQETLPAVRQDIADFAGDAEQFDDITMLGFSYFGEKKESEKP